MVIEIHSLIVYYIPIKFRASLEEKFFFLPVHGAVGFGQKKL
jgi:hypothetical protein